MKNHISLLMIPIALLLASCGRGELLTPTVTVQPTLTPDPCGAASLPGEVRKVNDLMREFDDYSNLASNTPQAQLIQVIPDLQRILREAEDQQVPSCLKTLKEYQLDHMKIVVQTLLAFLSNPDPQQINAAIAQAQQLHNQYQAEMARLLGVTLAAPATFTPLAGDTPAAGSTEAPAFVMNSGTSSITLLSAPDSSAGGVATLEAGSIANALGQTADGKWIQVEVPGQPGQKAWVDATLVTVSGILPVVTP